MKILFFGSSDYSYLCLKALPEKDIVGIITQPDKPGRKGNAAPTYLKEKMQDASIPIYQPENIKTAYALIKKINPDLIITAAYGQILPKEIVDYPAYGAVNIHASLLPKYKGASPIRQVILNNEKETGLTAIFMNEKIDEGDILYQQKVKIDEEETFSSLYQKLLDIIPEFTCKTLELIKSNEKGRPQEKVDSYSGKITIKDGFINWDNDCDDVDRIIRAFASKPGATCIIDDKTLKIFKSKKLDIYHDYMPGQIVRCEKDFFRVACRKGYIDIYEVQIPGKKIISSRDFINGNKSWLRFQLEKRTKYF